MIDPRFLQPRKPRMWTNYDTMEAGITCLDCNRDVDIVDIRHWLLMDLERNLAEYRIIVRIRIGEIKNVD